MLNHVEHTFGVAVSFGKSKANWWCVGIYSVVTCVMWSMECHVTTLYVHVYGINQMTVVRWKDVMYIVNDIG